jgi:sulfate transport system ATP-binding protein
MSFVGETASVAVERQGDRLLYEGEPLEAEVSGTLQGPGFLYLRPHDIEVSEPGAGKLPGVVANIRRTATGRRAYIGLGADTVIEAELASSVDVPVGRQVGLRILRGQVFER